MLIIILVLLLLSLSLFYYTQCHNKEGLDDGQLSKDPLLLATKNAANIAALSTQIKGLTGVKERSRQTATAVKTLNTQLKNLGSLKKQSLENAADLASLTKQVTPLLALKKIIVLLKLEADNNSKNLLLIGKQLKKVESQNFSINDPNDLNKTLDT